MGDGVVFYQSVSRGFSNPDGKRPVTYFGKVYRIPKSEHGTLRQLEWELTPDDLLASLPQEGGAAVQQVAGGIIERFEIYDQETGDVWVMYRIPYEREE